jgi:putative ABC transport system permease protein
MTMNKILLRKTVRDLKKNRAQTIALITVVALGMLSYVAAAGAFRDLDTSYQHTYDQTHFADVTFAVAGAPESVLEEVTRLGGVAAATGRLVIDAGYQLPGGEPIRARLIGLPPDQHPEVNDVLVLDGRYFDRGETEVVLLESHFADYYGIEPGDKVTPIINGTVTPLEVAGTVASPEYLVVSASRQNILPSARSFAVLFLPISALQASFAMESTVNDIAVLFNEGAGQETVIAAIEAILSPYQLESTLLQADQPSNAALRLDLEGFREVALIMPIILLLVAAASIYIMLGRTVLAQQQQIGLMKALGYNNRTVLVHYLAYALVIGLIGTVVGLLLGLLLSRQITLVYAQELGIPQVESRVYADLALSGAILSLLFAAAAGLGPARSATKRTPAEAMYMDPSTAQMAGRRSFLERWFRLPLPWRLPLRNVFRARRRTISNVIGIVFAFILILMTFSWVDSMQYMLAQTFEELARWDVSAQFNSPQSEALLTDIAAWDGVKAVEPAIVLPATVRANGQQKDIVLTAFAPEQQMQLLKLTGEIDQAGALGRGKIILTPLLASDLELAAGDEVMVNTALGERIFTLSANSDEMAGEVAYIALAEIQDLAPAPIFNFVYVQADPNLARQVKQELYQLPGVGMAQLRSDVRSDIEQLVGLFLAFTGIMVFLALAMAFALLFNTMTVSVLERQRELATMRAIGAGRHRLVGQLALESLITWLLALIPGMVLGYLLAVQVGKVFSSELFNFTIVILPRTYIITALGILLTMLVASWPAFRRISRMNLAEATKILT